jgi:hypothetical protein
MQLIEEAVLDAYTEEEQAAGFLTMIEDHLALPFPVKILDVDADVEKVDMTLDGQIVAICRRGKTGPRPSVDEKRDGRTAFHLHAGRHYRHELHEPLRMGRPESQSEQAAGEVFRRFCLRCELGDA